MRTLLIDILMGLLRSATLALVALALAACGSDANKAKSNVVCPSNIKQTYHELILQSKKVIPNKISIVIDGYEMHDECVISIGGVIKGAPELLVVREKKTLRMKLIHNKGFRVLPQDTSVEIFDRGNCQGKALNFYAASKIPLSFKTEYPDGPACGAQTHAKVILKN